jgi:hypothetical protein
VVPHAGRDRPAGLGHPAHLPQAQHRINHERNNQLRHRRIEATIRERQLLSR